MNRFLLILRRYQMSPALLRQVAYVVCSIANVAVSALVVAKVAGVSTLAGVLLAALLLVVMADLVGGFMRTLVAVTYTAACAGLFGCGPELPDGQTAVTTTLPDHVETGPTSSGSGGSGGGIAQCMCTFDACEPEHICTSSGHCAVPCHEGCWTDCTLSGWCPVCDAEGNQK